MHSSIPPFILPCTHSLTYESLISFGICFHSFSFLNISSWNSSIKDETNTSSTILHNFSECHTGQPECVDTQGHVPSPSLLSTHSSIWPSFQGNYPIFTLFLFCHFIISFIAAIWGLFPIGFQAVHMHRRTIAYNSHSMFAYHYHNHIWYYLLFWSQFSIG